MMIKRATARWPLVLLFVVFTEVITLTNAQTPEKAGILRPTDQAVLETEEVQVIARPGELWLDGKSLKEQSTQAMRQALSLRIPAGRHELIWKNGDTHQRIQFVVRTSTNSVVPPEWKAYRAHPPQAECQNCHAGRQPGVFKKATIAETCVTCHEQSAFAAGHAHNVEVLAECVLCHNPHGSTEKFHLKMTRETACKQCHG
jgi:predicted CXXCH cytochrome family protein